MNDLTAVIEIDVQNLSINFKLLYEEQYLWTHNLRVHPVFIGGNILLTLKLLHMRQTLSMGNLCYLCCLIFAISSVIAYNFSLPDLPFAYDALIASIDTQVSL